MPERPSELPTLFPLGQDGITLRFGDGFDANPMMALACAEMLRTANLTGVVDIATSLTSVLVRFAPDVVTRADLSFALCDLIEGQSFGETPQKPQRRWTIPCAFGGEAGPQLKEAATLAGRDEQAAIAEITGQDLSVLAIGFAPGQPYLGYLPESWDMPRQSALTAQVPAGALVVALRQLVLFANPSPTGWRWIGSCAFAPFRADRAEPFALRASDLIRFAAVDQDTVATLRANSADGMGGAVCEVLP